MSLAGRLFLTMAALIILAVGGAIAITYWQTTARVSDEIETALDTSQYLQRYLQRQSQRELELTSALLVSDQSFVAYTSQALNSGDSGLRSIRDLLEERRQQYDLDVAAVLDREGTVLTDSGDFFSRGQTLAELAAVSATLSDLSINSAVIARDDSVLRLAVVPLVRGRTVEAFVLTGSVLAQDFMSDVARLSRSDVAYLHRGSQSLEVVASSLAIDQSEALLRSLADSKLDLTQTTEPAADGQLELGGEDWSVRASQLSGQDDAMVLALVPRARLLASYSAMTQALIIAGLVALVLAVLISVVAARKVLQPVEALSKLGEDAARGRYPKRIDLGGGAEISRLSAAFNRLVADLREWQESDQFFGGLWRQRAQSNYVDGEPTAVDQRRDASRPSEPVAALLGDRYEIIRLVGEGGMGVVYEARDRELNEVVALKTLRADLLQDGARVDQLKAEIRLARVITHPNVVRTFDFAEADGVPMITMEYVRGITLEQALQQVGQLNLIAGLRVARHVCDGVASAHEAGVIHRDIKPGNIIIDNSQAKVMDFGIANGLTPVKDGELVAAGTPAYLSPEQIRGAPADVRSDVYALGVVFCEMFTGGRPFTGPDHKAVMVAHLDESPTPPSAHWPDIPYQLEAILLRCLEKTPSERFQTVTELREALEMVRLQQRY